MYPCYFGTDIDSSDKLIAFNHTIEETAQIIGVDSLGYLSIECLPELAENKLAGICNGCFTGKYPVEPPKNVEKSKFEKRISEQ